MQCEPHRAHRLLHMRTIVFAIGAAAVLAVGCSRSASLYSTPRAGRVSFGAPGDGVPSHLLTWINADHAQPTPDWTSVEPYLDYALVGQSIRDIQLARSIAAGGI